jgi:hypothetical protein
VAHAAAGIGQLAVGKMHGKAAETSNNGIPAAVSRVSVGDSVLQICAHVTWRNSQEMSVLKQFKQSEIDVPHRHEVYMRVHHISCQLTFFGKRAMTVSTNVLCACVLQGDTSRKGAIAMA